MTTDLATCPESLPLGVTSWTCPERVRSRAACQQPLTNFEKLQASQAQSARPAKASQTNLGVDLPDIGAPRPHRPHPGDVLYWVACVGGVCLLLLSATT